MTSWQKLPKLGRVDILGCKFTWPTFFSPHPLFSVSPSIILNKKKGIDQLPDGPYGTENFTS